MATNQKTQTSQTAKANAKAKAQAQATSVPAAPSAPPSVWVQAKTAKAQAQVCFAQWGNTMPTSGTVLAIGATPPKAGSGPRALHQQGIVAALSALGGQANLGACQTWLKAQGYTCQMANAGAAGNVRCSLQQGVLACLPSVV